MPYKDIEQGRKNKREYEKSHRKEANERSRKFYVNHKEDVLNGCKANYLENTAKFTENHLIKRYGITLTQYNELFLQQNGQCAICGRHQIDLNQSLCIDHCHVTGKVRGLLCRKCNSGIGMLGDSLSLLRRSVDYLEGTI